MFLIGPELAREVSYNIALIKVYNTLVLAMPKRM